MAMASHGRRVKRPTRRLGVSLAGLRSAGVQDNHNRNHSHSPGASRHGLARSTSSPMVPPQPVAMPCASLYFASTLALGPQHAITRCSSCSLLVVETSSASCLFKMAFLLSTRHHTRSHTQDFLFSKSVRSIPIILRSRCISSSSVPCASLLRPWPP